MNNENIKPWYRQLWPWLIIFLPLSSVVAGIITYRIASQNADSMVEDDYFKKGMAINQLISRQHLAEKLQLSAEISIDVESQLVFVKMNGNKLLQEKLVLEFSHPTRKDFDQSINLEKLSKNEYTGQLSKLIPANWYIRLYNQNNQNNQTSSESNDSWLLKSRWQYPESNILRITTKPR